MNIFQRGALAALCAVPSLASAIDCPVKGPEFLKAATDSMWTVVESKVFAGDGGCSIVGNAVLSSGAATGNGVTCEVTYFRGGKLKPNWSIERMQFAGADVKFPAKPPGDVGAQVLVQTRAERDTATSLNVVGVTLSTAEADCTNWRTALIGGSR
jgi:hypothetical protein